MLAKYKFGLEVLNLPYFCKTPVCKARLLGKTIL